MLIQLRLQALSKAFSHKTILLITVIVLIYFLKQTTILLNVHV